MPPPLEPPPVDGGTAPPARAGGESNGEPSGTPAASSGRDDPVIRPTGIRSSGVGPTSIVSAGAEAAGAGGTPAGRVRTSSSTRSWGPESSTARNAGLDCIRSLPRAPGDRPAIKAAGSRKTEAARAIPPLPRAVNTPTLYGTATARVSSVVRSSTFFVLPICTQFSPVVWTCLIARISLPENLIIKRLAQAIDPAKHFE